jgi:trans-aconitate methyltransferase
MVLASDSIIDLYERRAHDWVSDRSRAGAFIEKGWLDRFLGLIELGGTILDLGCGPGKPLAAYLLARGFDVCGVDSSPTMISLARSNFPDREWIIADMRALSLGRTFDGVMAWDSFFHLSFDDQRRMFPIFRATPNRGPAPVHERPSARRSRRQLPRRTALSRVPFARRISRAVRGERIRVHG